MTLQTERTKRYSLLSDKLSQLDDVDLQQLIAQSRQVYDGIGGTGKVLNFNGEKIFIKKIPLTALEQKSENHMNLANLYDLPLFCHYGVGSPGFSAWRELNVHQRTTEWVLNEQCIHFPILYHWRIIPAPTPEPITDAQQHEIDEQVKYWDNCKEVGVRIAEKFQATAHLILFLEYIPQTLYNWLGEQLKAGEETSLAALSKVQHDLTTTNTFMHTNGLIHFDAHFENLLTDGVNVYYSDFGLSLCKSFQLTPAEQVFYDQHYNYDAFSTLTNLLHTIVTSIFAADQWNLRLKEYINGELGEMLLNEYVKGLKPTLPKAIDALLKEHTPVVLRMDAFYRSLQHKSKSTPYPAAELEDLRRDLHGGSHGS